MPGFRWRTAIALCLGTIVVAGLMAYVGPWAILGALRAADPRLLVVGLLCYVAFFVVRGIRWRRLLLPFAPGTSARSLIALTAFGWMANSFLPMKAGDVGRAAIVARRQRASFPHVAGTVALERLFDVFGTACAASLGLLGAAVLAAERLSPVFGEALLVAWVLPLVAAAGLLLLAAILRGTRLRGRIGHILKRFVDAADELRRRPAELGPLLLLTLLTSALQVAMFVCVLRALAPWIPLSFALAGTPMFLLTFAIAVLPGNVGTYEASFVGVFSLFGLDPAALLPLAIAAHLLTTSYVTVLGGAAFGFDRLESPSQRAPASDGRAQV